MTLMIVMMGHAWSHHWISYPPPEDHYMLLMSSSLQYKYAVYVHTCTIHSLCMWHQRDQDLKDQHWISYCTTLAYELQVSLSMLTWIRRSRFSNADTYQIFTHELSVPLALDSIKMHRARSTRYNPQTKHQDLACVKSHSMCTAKSFSPKSWTFDALSTTHSCT